MQITRVRAGLVSKLLFAGLLLFMFGVQAQNLVPGVSIAVDPSRVDEGGDLLFTLTRTGDPASTLTVRVRIDEPEQGDGSRVLADIAPFDIPVVFPAGVSTTQLRVATDDDDDIESDVTITATVLAATVSPGGDGYYGVAPPASASVLVLDNDLEAINVRLDSGTYNVSEDGGTATVAIVLRSPDPLFDLSLIPDEVEGSTVLEIPTLLMDGTGLAGEDVAFPDPVAVIPYVSIGTLGGDVIYRFSLAATDDRIAEGQETLSVRLGTDGVSRLFRINQIPSTVRIQDNDAVSPAFVTPGGEPLDPSIPLVLFVNGLTDVYLGLGVFLSEKFLSGGSTLEADLAYEPADVGVTIVPPARIRFMNDDTRAQAVAVVQLNVADTMTVTATMGILTATLVNPQNILVAQGMVSQATTIVEGRRFALAFESDSGDPVDVLKLASGRSTSVFLVFRISPPGETLNPDENVEVELAPVPDVTVSPAIIRFTADSTRAEVTLRVSEDASAGTFMLQVAKTTLMEGAPDDRMLVNLPASQRPTVDAEVRPAVDFIPDLDEDGGIADDFNDAVDNVAPGAIATTVTSAGGPVYILVPGVGAETVIDAAALLASGFGRSLGVCVVHRGQPTDLVAQTVPANCDIVRSLAEDSRISLPPYRNVLYWVGLDANGEVATDSDGERIQLDAPRLIYIAPPVGFSVSFWLYDVNEASDGVILPLEIGGISGSLNTIVIGSGDGVIPLTISFIDGRGEYEYRTSTPPTDTEVQIIELDGVAFYDGVSAGQLDDAARPLVASHSLYSLGNDRITLVSQEGSLPASVDNVEPSFPKSESKLIPLGGYYDVVVYRYSSETRAFVMLGQASSARAVVIEASTGRVVIETFSRIPDEVRMTALPYPPTSSSIFEIVTSTATEVVTELADGTTSTETVTETRKFRVFGVDRLPLPLLGRGASSVTRVNGAGGQQAGPFAALADSNQLFADRGLFPDLPGLAAGVFDFVIGLAGGMFSPDGGLASVLIELADDRDVDGSLYYVYQQQPSEKWTWDFFMVDDTNRIFSAPKPCPAPSASRQPPIVPDSESDRVYAWQLADEGLDPDHRCVLVEFSDGGVNDADQTANAFAFSTGAFAVTSESRGGGGAMDPFWLLVLTLIVLFAGQRDRTREIRFG